MQNVKPLDPEFSRINRMERRVIALVASGYRYEEIADKFGNWSAGTIRNYMNNARSKCSASSIHQLIAICVHDGEIVQPENAVDAFISSDQALGIVNWDADRLTRR